MKKYNQLTKYIPNIQTQIINKDRYGVKGNWDRSHLEWDEFIQGPLIVDENKVGGYKLVNNELVFDQAQFDANQILIQELNQKQVNEENKKTQRKDLLKNQNANVNDRLNALIEHLGLDV